MTVLVALSRTNIEGTLVVVSGVILFMGSVWLLLAAIFGVRMGYLQMAVGMFGFMIVLSAIWAFGAPGTPPNLGPRGELPHWVAVAQGQALRSEDFPVVERYPGDPWKGAGDDAELELEVETAADAFTELLAEEATHELADRGLEGEVDAAAFTVRDVRFAEAQDGTQLAAARAFAAGGGPEVTVLAFKDQGDEELPSWLFLGASVLGFAIHLPFLDRAERRRKEILTGGKQATWRGPA